MKDNDIDLKDASANQPFSALLQHLTGVSIKKTQATKPVNLWQKGHREEIDNELKRRVTADVAKGAVKAKICKKMPSMRESIAHSMFKAQEAEEIEHWIEMAKEESNATVEQWKKAVNSRPSTMPADRQRSVQFLFYDLLYWL